MTDKKHPKAAVQPVVNKHSVCRNMPKVIAVKVTFDTDGLPAALLS